MHFLYKTYILLQYFGSRKPKPCQSSYVSNLRMISKKIEPAKIFQNTNSMVTQDDF